MNNSLHSHLIAQHIQGRMEEATIGRTVRAAKLARPREPKWTGIRRRLARRAPLGDVVTPR